MNLRVLEWCLGYARDERGIEMRVDGNGKKTGLKRTEWPLLYALHLTTELCYAVLC